MFKDNLARILSEKKKSEKMSQAQIARDAGVSASNITEWLKGRGSPNPEKLKKLARVLGVSLSELTGDPKPPKGLTPAKYRIPIPDASGKARDGKVYHA